MLGLSAANLVNTSYSNQTDCGIESMYVARISLGKRQHALNDCNYQLVSYFNSLSLRCRHKQGRGRESENRTPCFHPRSLYLSPILSLLPKL